MLPALTLLLLLQLVGEVIVQCLALPIPGPVLGMLFLFIALMLRQGPDKELQTTSQNLLQHLSLLFVPAGTGIMVHLHRVADEWLPLLLSLLFPFGFLVAIGYAGAVATLWTCIIPPLLAWKVRKAVPDGSAGFRAPGGILMIGLVILFGVLTAAFHLLNMAGLLPVYTG